MASVLQSWLCANSFFLFPIHFRPSTRYLTSVVTAEIQIARMDRKLSSKAIPSSNCRLSHSLASWPMHETSISHLKRSSYSNKNGIQHHHILEFEHRYRTCGDINTSKLRYGVSCSMLILLIETDF